MNDFVTVIKTTNPCNKLVKLTDNGELIKKSLGNISRAVAFSYRVDTPADMEQLLLKIGDKENYSLILGFIPSTEPPEGKNKGLEYQIVSEFSLRNLMGLDDDQDTPTGLVEHEGQQYTARLKINFIYSSWTLFDYDVDNDLPSGLTTDSYARWSTLMDDLIPGFGGASKVFAPSTSGRVMLNGEPAFPCTKGWHCFIQVANSRDIERFSQELKARVRGHDHGYIRRSKDGKEMFRTITDLTTFSPERLVHDGSPTVEGDGLSVAPVDVVVHEGNLLDTSKTVITKSEALAIEQTTGDKLIYSLWEGVRHVSTVNDKLLKMDTEIELCLGGGRSKVMTLREYVESGERKKLRCQTPFRESSSCNGFIAYPKNGNENSLPFTYDNGTHTRYELRPDEVAQYWWSVTQAWLDDKSVSKQQREKEWISHAKRLDGVGREKLRQAVGKKTGIGLTVLKQQLKDAEEDWTREAKAAAVQQEMARLKDEGVDVVQWREIELGNVFRDVTRSLFSNTRYGHIFSHAGELAHVTLEPPRSVRMVQRKHELGEAYPPMLVIRHYKSGGLLGRVSDGIIFELGNPGDGKFSGPPDKLIRMLMDSSPSWAHPLAGLVEFPIVRPDGSLMMEQGYDARTGLYTAFPRALTDDFVENPTKEDAAQALQYLKDKMLQGFEFKDLEDVSMSLICLLTMLQMPFLDTAPAYLGVASVQQSGKTTLLSLLFECVHGRPLACESLPADEVETDKRLTSILREGHQAALFDNITDGTTIEDGALSRYLTSTTYEGRVLGKTEMTTLPTDCLILFTGNNVKPGTDLISRVWPIRLESSTENPMDRSFARTHISAWVEKNRGKVLSAATCILQGYRLNGEVIKTSTSRYKLLDEMVRAPLEWLKEPDVMPLVELNRQEDEQVERERKLLAALHKTFDDELFTTSEVYNHYSEFSSMEDEGSLADALSDFFPKFKPTKISVGRALGKMDNRIVGGLKIVKISYANSKNPPKWRMVTSVASVSAPRSVGRDFGGHGGYTPITDSGLGESTHIQTINSSNMEGVSIGGYEKRHLSPVSPDTGNDCKTCKWDFICSPDPDNPTCYGDLSHEFEDTNNTWGWSNE